MSHKRSKKEILRLIWVTLTNAVALYEILPSFLPHRSDHLHIGAWAVEGMLSSAVLVLGILFETRSSGFAKYFNIGFYIYRGLWGVFGVLAAAGNVLGYTNESWIYFYLVSIPCFIVAAVNYFLYREFRSAPANQPI